jgi:hypothetical protein
VAALKSRRSLALLGAIGFMVVVAARWYMPQAPPMFEGAFIPPPYRYCSPPKNLASSNSQPAGGEADLQPINGINRLGTADTADPGGSQFVAFFAQGVFKTKEVVHVKISPRCAGAPPPPPHSTLVGNDYLLQAYTGASPEAGPPLVPQTPAQVLLRVPPIAYNTVRVFYDGSWHDTQFGAQTDLVNVSLDRLGDVAAFNDTGLQKKAEPPPSFNFVAILEAALIVIAVLIVAAGIVAQRRRGRVEAPTGAGPPRKGAQGEPGKASRRDRK